MAAEAKNMKEWALHYAEMGLAVFPLVCRDKVPAVVGGCKVATTERTTIERWWDKNPQYNIGIATGNKSSGLVVIDLDVDKNKGIDGYDVLRDWQNKHGKLPETWQSITGRGGYHYFYKADLLLSKICNANYNPAATCTLWEKTVNEIMQGDSSKIEYLQKMSGRFLTGDTSEEEFYIFFGATTRNGKSTITELLLYLLGDYATTISPESLAIKVNKDSRTASPDIAKLAGTRFVVASEPPRRMLFDSSLVKTLTGRDTVSARFLHENEFQFKPKFKLILNSNYLPVISDKTVFSSNRVKVVPFERHFTEKEQNKHLKEQLQQEIDGILNWCIQGLSLYRKEGLEPPTAVQIATHEYSEDSDKIGKFISECLEKSDQNLAAKDVYEKYSQWCNDCGLGVDGRTSFYEELKTKNLLSKTGTVTGKTVKNVIKGYSFVDETFHPVDGNFDTPFS